jgi:hypothetical protein
MRARDAALSRTIAAANATSTDSSSSSSSDGDSFSAAQAAIDDGTPANALQRRGGGAGRPPAAVVGEGIDAPAVVAEFLERRAKREAWSARGSSSDGSGTVTTVATSAPAAQPAAGGPPIPFTTSPLPGTTLGVIGAPLDPHGHAYIYDTPGIILDAFKQRLLEGLALRYGSDAATGLRALTPGDRARFITYRLRPGRSLFLGGLVRLAYSHPDASADILVTVCSRLPVHTTRSATAGELWLRHHGAAVEEEEDAASSFTAAVYNPGKPQKLLHPAWSPLDFWTSCNLRDCVPASSLVVPPHVASRALSRSADVETEAGGFTGTEEPLVSYLPQRLDREVFVASAKATEHRRRTRTRTAIVDVVFPALGWLAVTPIEIEGMWGWSKTVAGASLHMHYCRGLRPHVRSPLLPYEASGTHSSEWLQ